LILVIFSGTLSSVRYNFSPEQIPNEARVAIDIIRNKMKCVSKSIKCSLLLNLEHVRRRLDCLERKLRSFILHMSQGCIWDRAMIRVFLQDSESKRMYVDNFHDSIFWFCFECFHFISFIKLSIANVATDILQKEPKQDSKFSLLLNL
jgi:hypothetical protein